MRRCLGPLRLSAGACACACAGACACACQVSTRSAPALRVSRVRARQAQRASVTAAPDSRILDGEIALDAADGEAAGVELDEALSSRSRT